MSVQVSLFASAVRPAIWPALFKSLVGTSVDYEVVFAGDANDELIPRIYLNYYPKFNPYIQTGRIKPAQCYEIARRHCIGETVVWIADDCEFPNDVIGKAYKYWKSKNDEKLILSIQTAESGYGSPTCELFDMNLHRFYGGGKNTPLMAPICFMSRKFLDELGGLDRRYICGQYENDIVMRAYQHGATVEIFGDKDCCVEIDHLRKSYELGESYDIETFEIRPFAKGYGSDRKILEESWSIFDHRYAFKILESNEFIHEVPSSGKMPFSIRRVVDKQLDSFEPYAKDISLTKSESNNLTDRWE